MEIKKFAFLNYYKIDDNGSLMGAVMVTDEETKPLEFRVTSTITPTNFQKILYGDVLKEHILVELIAIPLLKSITETADLVMVNDKLFLNVAKKENINICLLSKESLTSNENIIIETIHSVTENLSIGMHKSSEDEFQSVLAALNPIISCRNLLEPFERLNLACEQVHLKNTRA